MNPTQLFDPASHSYTYILFDETTREALILDPVAEQLQRDLDTVARLNLKLIGRWKRMPTPTTSPAPRSWPR